MTSKQGMRRSASSSAFIAQPAPYFTEHARLRAAQRNLALDAVRYVMAYGREIRRTGVTFFILTRRDIPAEDLRLAQIARLEGSVALVAHDGAIITLYRNPASVRTILRKAKYNTSSRRGSSIRHDARALDSLHLAQWEGFEGAEAS